MAEQRTLDAEGLPELPEPYGGMLRLTGGIEPVYTAEQVRQAMRDAVAADRRARRPIIRTTLSPEMKAALEEAFKTRSTAALLPGGSPVFINYGDQPEDTAHLSCTACGGSGHIDDQQQLARQSAPEGAPVACEHKGERTTHWDYIRCSDCGAVKTDSSWGIAKNQWFKDKDEAEFYKKTGARPAAPTSASAQPEAQAFELLRQLLASSSGKQVLWKLSDGIGTDTDEGRAWLAAKALVEANAASPQPAEGDHHA